MQITHGQRRGMASGATTPGWRAAILFVGLIGRAASVRADAFHDHIDRGNLFANEQNLVQAVREFEAAYQLKKQPVLLLNIGRIYLKLRRGESAQRYCAMYLTEEFDLPPDRKAKAVDCVTQARQLVAAKKAAAVSPSAAVPPATAAQGLAAKAPALPSSPSTPALPGADLGMPQEGAGTPPQGEPAITPRWAPVVASVVVHPPVPPVAPGPEQEPRQPEVWPPPSAASPPRVVTPPPPILPSASLRISEPVPVYRRWWFWTIIGAGAAGVAAGISASVLSNRGPTDPVYELGDVPPENQRTVTMAQ